MLGNVGAGSSGKISTTTNYDQIGRPIYSSLQIGSGSKYETTHNLDLAGDVVSETYPSGRVVTTSYDVAMRPVNMKGTLGSASTPYVQQVGYFPQGSVYYWQYGNNVWPVQTFTKNLQPSISYTTVNNDSSKYLLYLQDNWSTNGMVTSGVNCYGAAVTSANMTCLSSAYGYDNLNRLTSAGDSFYQNPSSGNGYGRNYSYDEYGNMSLSSYSMTVPPSGLTPQTSQSPFNKANNRLNAGTYDARGNMTLVASGSVGMSYDGENRQTQMVDPGTGQTASYLYDAAGQRVQKQVGSVTVVYVHDAFGKLVAEYNSAGVTPSCTTCYLVYDQLGSVRLITDQNANVMARHDYLPYGEEIPNGQGGRSGNGFGNDTGVTQKFTGQERDGGTAVMDYFNARSMSAVLGRFTQPDPGGVGADVGNPQTWNGYAYVGGNPLGATDPSGMSFLDKVWGWLNNRGNEEPTPDDGPKGEAFNCIPFCVFSTTVTTNPVTMPVRPKPSPAPPSPPPPTPPTPPVTPSAGSDIPAKNDPPALFVPLDILKWIPPIHPKFCSGGGFALIGNSVKLFGIKAGAYAIPAQYDSKDGGSSGFLVEAEVPHTPVSIAYEGSVSWRSGKYSNSGLALGGAEAASAKLGVVSAGGFVGAHGTVGAYGSAGIWGGGAYGDFSLTGDCQ